MDNFPFFPPQASSVAGQVDLLLIVLIALSSIFTTLVVVLIVYFGIKYRRGAVVDRSNPPNSSLKMELAWVGGLLVLSMGTFVWAAVQYMNIYTTPPNALEIYVVGQQWMWKFQHPEGVREIDELHVPLGRKIKLIMTSQDVIHSFYVPAFRIKYDVLPGRYTSIWFEATEVGEYHLFCAEYCGTRHSFMTGKIIVMEPHDYQEWLSSAPEGAPLSQSGEELFAQAGCGSCHLPDSGERAPILNELFGQQVPLESGESVTADETYIRESILFPNEKIVAGYQPIMPTYEGKLTEEQLIELVAYIKSLGSVSSPEGESSPGSSAPPPEPSAGPESGAGSQPTPERTVP